MKKEIKNCLVCGKEHKNKKYCSNKCKGLSEEFRSKLSTAFKGVPKPYNCGENNPNFGNKSQHNNGGYEKLVEAAKKRGQAWTDEHKKAHSELMKGSANKMRGKKHKQETKDHISKVKLEQYRNGEIVFNIDKVSNQEKEIADFLDRLDVKFSTQYQIPGHSFFYDFYLEEYNILLEFYGDYWHANPKKYKPGTRLKIGPSSSAVEVSEKWDRDEFRKNIALDSGYKFYCIWESDYKKDGFKAIESILEKAKDEE